MGTYTELNIGIELKKDIPNSIIEVLKIMTSLDDIDITEVPDHPLFKTESWERMLMCESYYFDAKSVLRFEYDAISKTHFLTVICNLKNYDNEIQKFLDWICPYINTQDYIGHIRQEEDLYPTLLYCDPYKKEITTYIVHKGVGEILWE